jgi:hypothetical protein
MAYSAMKSRYGEGGAERIKSASKKMAKNKPRKKKKKKS